MSKLLAVSMILLALAVAPAFASQKIADVPYGTDKEQRFDVYVPEEALQNAPIIFMVHGGAWRIGDKDNSRVVENKSEHFNSHGYIFISANYRMDGDISPLLQADDIVHAVMEVEKRAKEWGGDPSRIVLMGHSAGAHLVGLISAAPPALQYPWRGSILLDSAAMDLVTIMSKSHYRFYDRVFGKDREFWKQSSPYYQLQTKVAPVLLVCSTKRDNSCDQAEAFRDKGTKLGSRMEILQENKTHGEINYEIGEPGDYTETIDKFIQSVL